MNWLFECSLTPAERAAWKMGGNADFAVDGKYIAPIVDGKTGVWHLIVKGKGEPIAEVAR